MLHSASSTTRSNEPTTIIVELENHKAPLTRVDPDWGDQNVPSRKGAHDALSGGFTKDKTKFTGRSNWGEYRRSD